MAEVAMSRPMEVVEVMSKGATTEEAAEDMTKEATTVAAVEGMTHPTEAVEAMNTGVTSEEGEDVVAMTMEPEGEAEEANPKEAGLMVEEVAIKMSTIGIVTTETQAFKLGVITVVAAIKEVAMVVINLHIQEADIKVVAAATSKTTDIKMGTPMIEVEAAEEAAAVVVAAVAGKEVAGGEQEVHRTLIKGGNLSSTSNMGDISTISLDLDKEDTSQAEAAKASIWAELM